MAQYQQGAPPSNGETFFGLRIDLAERCCENLQSAESPAQCKSRPGNSMVSRRNHLLCHFSVTIYIHLAGLYEKKYLKKISQEKCSLNKLLNLNWGGLGPLALVVNALLQLVIFMTKQKFLRKIFNWIIISAKTLHEAKYLASHYLGPITNKI